MNRLTETDESNVQELQESLDQATYKNIKAEDYRNIDINDETEADVKEISEFIENNQQSKEEEEDGIFQEQLENKLKTYCDDFVGFVCHRCGFCRWVKRQPCINLLYKYLLYLYRTYKRTLI
jgi:hypothetical protein